MRNARSLIEARPNRGLQLVAPPVKSPVWIDGHSLRRQIQNPFLNRMLRRLFPDERRYPRLMFPPLVAYLGGAGSSKPFAIENISVGGFCLKADEFWTPGTVLSITLERSDEFADGSDDKLTLPAVVVRREGGAAAFAIAMASEQALLFPAFRFERSANLHEQMRAFLKKITSPVPVPTRVAVDAPASSIQTREQRLELLLASARNHRLSDAWNVELQEDGEDASVVVTIPSPEV